jgi:hypothetical protein
MKILKLKLAFVLSSGLFLSLASLAQQPLPIRSRQLGTNEGKRRQ